MLKPFFPNFTCILFSSALWWCKLSHRSPWNFRNFIPYYIASKKQKTYLLYLSFHCIRYCILYKFVCTREQTSSDKFPEKQPVNCNTKFFFRTIYIHKNVVYDTNYIVHAFDDTFFLETGK